MTSARPLIVDLDGTLLRGDSLHESVAAALRTPLLIVRSFAQLVTHGKAALKRSLANGSDLDVNLLPVNKEVLDYVRAQRSSGRSIYLATGADSSVADQIMKRFPEFAGSFSSDGSTNLTSTRKAELLVREFGSQGFDYIGNSIHDVPVWHEAQASYLVTSRAADRPLPVWARDVTFAEVFREPSASPTRVWLRELRVHQSLKNLLLFLPLVAAHSFADPRPLLLLVAGFISFTLMASSVYLLNDLLDLRADRLHSRKSARPLAAGRILPLHALAVSAILAIFALLGAVAIGLGFTMVLIAYAILTCLYSFWLKRVTLVDVVVLAMLYMIRILAGSVIAGITLSFWFTGVGLFLFISLALVKRYTELSKAVRTDSIHTLHGRGYTPTDSAVILPLGIASGMAALLLLAIYLQSDAVTLLYPSGVFLWLVIPALFYWIANLWIQAGRDNMHDDPIVFALKNPSSLASGGIIAVLFVVASTPLNQFLRSVLSQMGVL